MIDGQKLTDHTNYGQPILIDPTTTERIEVVRGSSSVVSGSAAIGGVINIITKTGADKPFALSTTAGVFLGHRGLSRLGHRQRHRGDGCGRVRLVVAIGAEAATRPPRGADKSPQNGRGRGNPGVFAACAAQPQEPRRRFL